MDQGAAKSRAFHLKTKPRQRTGSARRLPRQKNIASLPGKVYWL
jgi:hypothetical protein